MKWRIEWAALISAGVCVVGAVAAVFDKNWSALGWVAAACAWSLTAHSLGKALTKREGEKHA